MENVGSTSSANYLLRFGDNCRVLAGRFKSCKGTHILTDATAARCSYTNLDIDTPDVGQPASQGVLNVGTDDILDRINIQNPVTPHATNAQGIRSDGRIPRQLTNINVSGFATGRNIAFTFGTQFRLVTGNETLARQTQTAYYTGAGGHTITLPPMSSMTERMNYPITIKNAGAGVLTLAPSVGDSSSGNLTLAAGAVARFFADVETDTWRNITQSDDLLLANNKAVMFRNAADSANLNTLTVNASNHVNLGHGAAGSWLTLNAGDSGGYLQVSNTSALNWTGTFFRPFTTNQLDLGLSTQQWKRVYLQTGVFVGGTQIVGAQGAAVTDATDAASVITQLNALLARLRTHGLIAT
jgi:hypothetical protein